MKVFKKLAASSLFLGIPVLAVLLLCPTGVRAQYLPVDCTGANPSAYPSITAALPNATPGSFILVTGPCNENVSLNGVSGLNLGAYYGQTATINGSITITNSENLFLYGLNVTNPAGNGISVSSSRGISLNVCSSSGNSGVGLAVNGMSDVTIGASGAFSHNGAGGMNINGNSTVGLVAWAGPVDISNNVGAGVAAFSGNFNTLGPTTITNNTLNGTFSQGYGLDLRGGGRAQIGALFGPNVISGNQNAGASLQENAEISFWSIGQPNLIQGNGPVGVLAGFGSQVTFADISGPLGAVITDHTSAGVDLYANSQVYFLGANQVLRNGTLANPRTAGIRVDGNSEVFMRGGQVAQNNGPAILALLNSSVDFTGVTFAGNAQGQIITCDSSSWMVSDLAKSTSAFLSPGVACKTPHGLGNRDVFKSMPTTPDWSAHKAQFDKYAKTAVKH
ncbi:MAG TPA: right-handed parallel beta-helix repeat-containing protein [Candidatus Acidoferrum sp.]|nr:right-handed parallel beta-helix repeat-containing protein [Candidatus Acidoferrum sp.]